MGIEDNKYYKMSSKERELFAIRRILEILQLFGGQMDRGDICEKMYDDDEELREFSSYSQISKKTGTVWYPWSYRFNFGLNYLRKTGFLSYQRSNPSITLTEKGINVDIASLDVEKEVYNPAQNISGRNLNKKENLDSNEGDVDESANLIDEYQREFKEKLLKAIEKMSPKKFEIFSRALLNKMGVEFDEVGARVSCDGGIDGHGYCLTDDFRTSCVVIQCKRWQGVIGSPEIDKFLGAMNKFHADYGVFITNSNYSREARAAAHAGTPITLIDGDELVRLVIKYRLYISSFEAYILEDFYDTED